MACMGNECLDMDGVFSQDLSLELKATVKSINPLKLLMKSTPTNNNAVFMEVPGSQPSYKKWWFLLDDDTPYYKMVKFVNHRE